MPEGQLVCAHVTEGQFRQPLGESDTKSTSSVQGFQRDKLGDRYTSKGQKDGKGNTKNNGKGGGKQRDKPRDARFKGGELAQRRSQLLVYQG